MGEDSAYIAAGRGSLKLKGGASLADKKKKKKKSSSSAQAVGLSGAERRSLKGKDREVDSDDGHEATARSADAATASGPQMTESERRFEEARRKRMAERVAKEAKLSHKDKVDQFNQHLASLTEHFDLPKVGPG